MAIIDPEHTERTMLSRMLIDENSAGPSNSTAGPRARGPSLVRRLADGPVLCAEGYLFELERRGYLQAGAFVPEVVLEHPEQVESLHEQFVHAGSDVVVAFTYYAHREKLRLIGRSGVLEPLNRQALDLARRVADRTGTLLAGNICNTNVYDPTDPSSATTVRAMFTEQVGWAVDAGVDLVVAETFRYADEALIAQQVLTEAGVASVVTVALGQDPLTRDGWAPGDAARRLTDAGATVVGLNCLRGPATILEPTRQITAAVDVPVACLPVPYRTSPAQPTFQSLRDPAAPLASPEGGAQGTAFPTGLDAFTATRYEVAAFTDTAVAAGVRYLGLCCGAAPHHIRAMAESLGRTPPASRYSPDMTRHAYLGSDASLLAHNRAYATHL